MDIASSRTRLSQLPRRFGQVRGGIFVLSAMVYEIARQGIMCDIVTRTCDCTCARTFLTYVICISKRPSSFPRAPSSFPRARALDYTPLKPHRRRPRRPRPRHHSRRRRRRRPRPRRPHPRRATLAAAVAAAALALRHRIPTLAVAPISSPSPASSQFQLPRPPLRAHRCTWCSSPPLAGTRR